MYLAACRRLGVAPEECLYVGDGGSRELSGAASVGIVPLRLAAPDLARHLVFHADDWTGPAVGSLTEVLDVLDRRTRWSEARAAAGVP
jgi:putative hydrolase of the HAD superfamily